MHENLREKWQRSYFSPLRLFPKRDFGFDWSPVFRLDRIYGIILDRIFENRKQYQNLGWVLRFSCV
ncbi:MAG: hypothetical protein FWE67_07870 [Planctomycetaceae bacterium]|nr:hypothetical protein [Planctomycetaceae bacterium]